MYVPTVLSPRTHNHVYAHNNTFMRTHNNTFMRTHSSHMHATDLLVVTRLPTNTLIPGTTYRYNIHAHMYDVSNTPLARHDERLSAGGAGAGGAGGLRINQQFNRCCAYYKTKQGILS